MRLRMDIMVLTERHQMWRSVAKRSDKKRIVEQAADHFGVTKATVYDRFRELDNDVNRSVVAGYQVKKVHRKSEHELEEILSDMIVIAKIKMGGKVGKSSYGISTELALIAAENMGYISKGKYTRSTADRWLSYFGLTLKQIENPSLATELVSPYSNHVWFVDATVKNHYYLNIRKNRIDLNGDIRHDISHGMDILEKEGLKRIWDYALVDNYSKAYLMMTFAPDPKTPGAINGGENMADWITFLTYAFNPKNNPAIPIYGLPQLIVCDKGSGLMSDSMKKFLTTHGVDIRSHEAGNSSAKGAVESRIGAFKRTFGVTINKKQIYTIEELNSYNERFIIYDNQKKGLYQKWVEGTKNIPLRKPTNKTIADARVSEMSRVVKRSRTVSIDGIEYFTSSDIDKGTRVSIFTDAEGNRACQSPEGKIYPLKPYGKVQRDPLTFKILDGREEDMHQTEVQKLRERVKKESLKFKENISPEKYLKDSNMAFFPVKGEEIETHSPMAPEQVEKLEDAVRFVLIETGYTEEEIGEETMAVLRQSLNLMLSELGYIPGGHLHKIVNIYLSTGTDG